MDVTVVFYQGLQKRIVRSEKQRNQTDKIKEQGKEYKVVELKNLMGFGITASGSSLLKILH